MLEISNGLNNTNVVAVNGPVQHAIVKTINILSEDLYWVSFAGKFDITSFFPGQVIAFHIDQRQIRRYTLSFVDPAQGAWSVLFYLNGRGLGSNWVRSLQAGQVVPFTPEPGQLFYNEQATHHFFFGDETAMGLFYGYKEIALQNNHEYFGVLELQPANEPVLNVLKLLVDSVPVSAEMPAHHAIHWMEDMHPNCWKAWKKAEFYLAGRALSIKAFRNYLLQKQVAPQQIHTMAYWAE